jgi:hypothetical protein
LRVNVESAGEYSDFEESVRRAKAFASLQSKSIYIYPSGKDKIKGAIRNAVHAGTCRRYIN